MNDSKVFLESLNMPVMNSFDDLADELRLTKGLVYWLSKEDADGKYHTYFKKKKSGKFRQIDAPVLSLKIVQRWILENMLYKIKCSPYCYGFAPAERKDSKGDNGQESQKKDKSSPQAEAAERHRYNLFLLKMDIKDFYPSILRPKVFYLFRDIGYNKDISNLLTNICTWKGRLPQGAPTSAYLANLICRRMDRRIAGYCNKRNIVYTRYADDLIFSSDDREMLLKAHYAVRSIVESEGFKLNDEKTSFAGTGKRKEVLGIIINDKRVKASKEMKRMVRSMIHQNIATGEYKDSSRIRGYIAYISSIEKDYEKKARTYIKSLSESTLCLFPDVVAAYNKNKIFKDLPDMKVKLPVDLGLSEADVEKYKKHHQDFLFAYDAKYHPERIDGGALALEDENPFK